jgi:dipeptide transport system permease protein
MAGERGIDSAARGAAQEYRLDRPVLVNTASTSAACSMRSRQVDDHAGTGAKEFLSLFPATIELALCAIIFALVIGIPAGMIAAVPKLDVRPRRDVSRPATRCPSSGGGSC